MQVDNINEVLKRVLEVLTVSTDANLEVGFSNQCKIHSLYLHTENDNSATVYYRGRDGEFISAQEGVELIMQNIDHVVWVS